MNMLRKNIFRALSRYYSEGSSRSGPATSSIDKNTSSSNPINDVPGLSSTVIHPTNEPVGPGVDPQKTGAYKVPEYFCYDNMSFFEAEIEMSKFRLPQPSAIKK